MTTFPEPTIIDAGGVRLATYQSNGDPSLARPPIVLVHGWPEIAYSWKNVIPALSDAGFHVIALDLKGFGRSDTPADKALYDIQHMTGDLAALLDALEIEKAVFCGHDWGGAIVWPMAQLHADRVAGVIGVCTPHKPPPPVPPLQILEKRFTGKHYFIQFQEDGIPEQLFETDIDKFFRIMFRAPPKRDEWEKLVPRIYDLPGRFRNGPTPSLDEIIVSKEDMGVFVDAYRRSGFRGGINLYRNVDRNYEITRNIDPIIPHEALWVGAGDDLFLPAEGADGLEKIVPNVEKQIIPDCGHWVMWEKPAELNGYLVNWMLRKFAA